MEPKKYDLLAIAGVSTISKRLGVHPGEIAKSAIAQSIPFYAFIPEGFQALKEDIKTGKVVSK